MENEPYIFDGGIVKFRWNPGDPYIYQIMDEKQLENVIYSKDDLNYLTGDIRKQYDEYKKSFEVIYEGEMNISDKLIQRIIKSYQE